MVRSERFTVQTRRQGDTHDLTREVTAALARSGLRDGIVTVFVVGSTAAITTIEFESGAVADFDRMLSHLAPYGPDYQHHLRWGDDNGSSHVRAALLGPSVTVPFAAGRLALGTWQQLVLVECDTSARAREIVVQMVGD